MSAVDSPEAGSANAWLVEHDSPIHGRGLFACVTIPKGQRVIEYRGERITKPESLARCEAGNVSIFALDDGCDLDGSVDTNPARRINHCCAPNCDTELDAGRIWVVARRDIVAGEEITFNYGYDLEDFRQHPCHCGAPTCVGYIVAEEFFDMVRRIAALVSNPSAPDRDTP